MQALQEEQQRNSEEKIAKEILKVIDLNYAIA